MPYLMHLKGRILGLKKVLAIVSSFQNFDLFCEASQKSHNDKE